MNCSGYECWSRWKQLKCENFYPFIHSKLNMVGLIFINNEFYCQSSKASYKPGYTLHFCYSYQHYLFLRHDGDSYIENMSPLLIFLLCLYKFILNCLIRDYWLHRHLIGQRFVQFTKHPFDLNCSAYYKTCIHIIYIILPAHSSVLLIHLLATYS